MKKLLILVMFMASLAGCEKGLDTIEYDSKIYLPTAGVLNLQPLLGESIYELTVYKSGINSGKAVTVDLIVDKDAFLSYQSTEREAVLLPEAMFSVEPMQVTFEKDEIEKSVFVHIKKVDATLTNKHFILPLTLANNEDIADDKKTTLIKLSNYRNQFQGKYKANGKFFLKYNENESEKIGYIAQTKTISTNVFEVSTHVTNMNLWVEVNENGVTLREAGNMNQFRIQDKGSSITGGFDLLHQRFNGSFDLSFTYEANSRAYEAEMTLIFDL